MTRNEIQSNVERANRRDNARYARAQREEVARREAAATVEQKDGRWYITMGNAGFNSPANNRNGYASKAAAEKAHNRYASKGTTSYRTAIEIGAYFSQGGAR